jgi:hypothetical protein
MKRHAQSPKALSLMARCAAMAALVTACIGSGAFTASAGSLTPPGPPGPTIQQKPTWDKTIPVAQRFVNALDTNASGAYEAVLDKETGLVWAKAPDSVGRTWDEADVYCTTLNLGGRMGWRLPTVAELSSLIDKTNPKSPQLPAGQTMFQNIQFGGYWSSIPYADSPLYYAWSVLMSDGNVAINGKIYYSFVWPVRAGQ